MSKMEYKMEKNLDAQIEEINDKIGLLKSEMVVQTHSHHVIVVILVLDAIF